MFDTIIIGSGPAGLTAAIYASRYKMSHIMLGKQPGGTVTYAHKLGNYPGLPGITGLELAQKMIKHAESLGTEIMAENVVKLEKEGDSFLITSETNKEYLTHTVVVATGTERRKLQVPGEKEYLGRGVSYCTTCDAPFFKGKIVALVGGNDGACGGATHLSEFAEKIYLIYRKDQLRAEPFWVEEVLGNPKIEVVYNTNVTAITGDEQKVTAIKLDKPYCGQETLSVDGIFVEIGGIPASSFLVPAGVELNDGNYVVVNEKMETNIPGIFAAGDVTDRSLILQQAITAIAQGAIAVSSVYKFLTERKK